MAMGLQPVTYGLHITKWTVGVYTDCVCVCVMGYMYPSDYTVTKLILCLFIYYLIPKCYDSYFISIVWRRDSETRAILRDLHKLKTV